MCENNFSGNVILFIGIKLDHHFEDLDSSQMSKVMRKSVFRSCHQVRLKPRCLTNCQIYIHNHKFRLEIIVVCRPHHYTTAAKAVMLQDTFIGVTFIMTSVDANATISIKQVKTRFVTKDKVTPLSSARLYTAQCWRSWRWRGVQTGPQ